MQFLEFNTLIELCLIDCVLVCIVEVSDGKITSILEDDLAMAMSKPLVPNLDFENAVIMPGLIDV